VDVAGDSYPVPTDRRGRLVVGPLRLRRFGPAGLTVSSHEAEGQDTVRVRPRLLPVRAVPRGARHGHVDAAERAARGGTDIIGLREYQPGDDLRRVHWGTSARAGMLMVREDADPLQAHLTVVLDDGTAAYARPDDFEEAVEVAASLLSAAAADGHPVRLRTLQRGLDLDAEHIDRVLSELVDVSLVDSGGERPLAPDDLDVVAVVTGEAADIEALVAAADRAEVGAVLVVGSADDPVPGHVAVLRAPTASELLGAWDDLVSARVVTT